MKSGVELIAAERERQVTKEGWTPEHDDEHSNGEMAFAAACYAVSAVDTGEPVMHEIYEDGAFLSYPMWPEEWDKSWDKRDKHSDLRKLAIAGALIAAEIDRIQRSANV